MVSREGRSGPSIGVVCELVGGRHQRSTLECHPLCRYAYGEGASVEDAQLRQRGASRSRAGNASFLRLSDAFPTGTFTLLPADSLR